MTNTNHAFKSSNYSFVSAALLSGITSITAHRNPENPTQTIFHLKPQDKVEKLYQEYMKDELKFSPRQLSQAIRDLKGLPVEENLNSNFEKNYQPSGTDKT